jgi:hypothetical protein
MYRKSQPSMLPPAFNTVVPFTRILRGRTNQSIIVLSSTRGHFLVYFCRPRTPLSTASALISSVIMSSTKFLDEKFHFFSASQDLSTWLPPAPRFWLEVPMCQYAGEDSDTSPHRTALGKFWGLFRGRGTPFWARTLSLIHLFRSTIVKPSWSHTLFSV